MTLKYNKRILLVFAVIVVADEIHQAELREVLQYLEHAN
jgi:hypothetical protein